MFAAIGSVLFGTGEETPANDVDVAEDDVVVEMTNNPTIDVVHVDFCLHKRIPAPFFSFKAPTYELQRKVDSTRRETYSISSCTELSCTELRKDWARIIYDGYTQP